MCAPGKLFNVNICHKLFRITNANIHNLKSFEKAPILKNKLTLVIPKRSFFGWFKRPSKNQLKIADNVPDEYILIYRNTMDRYIFFAQLITTLSAFIIIVSSIIKHDLTNMELDFSSWTYPPRQTENEIYVYVAAFTCLVVILQVLVSRLPIRIYNLPQQKKYIFVIYGNYPFTQKKLTTKVGEIASLPETGISPWKNDRYIIKNQQTLILLDKYFRRPADLYIMLGVQRDPDVDEKE
ncbi:hypothetical protein NQ314_017872 [Rhamnusium bicolor]|uniref:Uncharacterized protein n=1 Tax=Rhamnusium bicolor TaxID=1586634 RepID=A0AAV8WS81_9CUCU|nr:hypothetical protein NQ314_017872 [Rhamnusium bicolor]